MALNDAVFDTNILIDHLNDIQPARVVITRYIQPSISIITWMEVLAGANAGNEARTRTLLNQFKLIQITPEIAEAAAVLRRLRKFKLPDAIILASAHILCCALVTRNTRDFDRNQPNILVPYEI